MYDIIIIGAGAIGGFIARELSRYRLNILVLEKEKELCGGVTKANTSIVHSGYSPKPGTIKSILNKESMKIFSKTCEELKIPYKKTGSLLIALEEDSLDSIYKKYERGLKNGIKNLEILNREEILKLEPNLNPKVIKALYSADTGIVDNFQLVIGACENARENGVEFKLGEEVLNMEKRENFKVYTNKEEYESKALINCAGLFADEINNKISSEKIKIKPKKGQYFILSKDTKVKVNNVIFLANPENNKKLKGIIVAPTVNGNIIIGPSATDTKNKEDLETNIEVLENIKEISKILVPELDFQSTIKTFGALRPKLDLKEDEEDDFIIEESKDIKGLINVAGIKSPGLTCAPSIGIMVSKIVENVLGNLEENKDFNPNRNMKKTTDEKLYNKIICRCENISEGEIVNIVRNSLGEGNIRNVKINTMAAMGKCQGGYCMARIMEIISREVNKPVEEIL